MPQESPQLPLIIIGMHRSGTSLIAETLQKLGFFMGWRKDRNFEAKFFININVWLFRRSQADWYVPARVDELVHDTHVRKPLVEYLRFLIGTPRTFSFLGYQNFIRFRHLKNLAIPWGWKDPRNTYTLPLWLDVFPRAKVLHIYRNGVDVASSLQARSKTLNINTQGLTGWKQPQRGLMYSFVPGLNPPFSAHLITLEEGFTLWETYTRRADSQVAALPAEQTKTISYEGFLTNTAQVTQEICDFAEINVSRARIQAATNGVITTRAFAYQNHTELMEFYHSVKQSPQMVRYSY
jgi:hypothetical protein